MQTIPIVVYWRRRYACAPSRTAAAISCMRGLPASAFITDAVAQMAYTTESTPQSTINHNAVIEFASNLKVTPRRGREIAAGAQKAGPPAQKGGLKSAGT